MYDKNSFITPAPDKDQYDRFLKYGIKDWTNEDPTCVKYDFKDMMRLFGRSYIYFLEIQHKIWLDPDSKHNYIELCKWHGNVPAKFFDRFYKYQLKKGYQRSQAITLKDLRELKPGDFVTHIDHGIGRFGGLQKL